ncbi:MAG TPA: alpha/beta hydrolase, partial [Puia sp.]|nr:alpha/beta hydrolase [Puia sp.]
MKTYFISGIAADGRIFRRIRLPAGWEAVYLNWIKPIPGEPLENYAVRLAEKINRDEPFVVIGTSLGGIVATEIALKYNPVAVVIIGSVPTVSQLPGYFRMAGKMRLYKIMPASVYKISVRIKHWLTRENQEDKNIILQMINETDTAFIKWGIEAVLKWRNTQIPKSLYHIQGTRDKMFPYTFTSPTHTIFKGDHMIV